MTTLEPGASVVFTQGLRDSPLSTAFLASSAAATITDGFDVLVQDVIAAITTAPWSRTQSVPSASRTGVGVDVRPCAPSAAERSAGAASVCVAAIGSEAGNVSSTDSSTAVRT